MNLTDIKNLPKFDQLRITHYKDLTSTSDIHLVHTIILSLLLNHKEAKSKKDILNLTGLSTQDIDRGLLLLFKNSKTDNRREGLPFTEKDRKYSLHVPLSSGVTWKNPESASSGDKIMAKTITDSIKNRKKQDKEDTSLVVDYEVDDLDNIFNDVDTPSDSETLISQIKTYSGLKESVNLKRKTVEDAMKLLESVGISEVARKKFQQNTFLTLENDIANHSLKLKDSLNKFIQNL